MSFLTVDEISKATRGSILSRVAESCEGYGTDTRVDLKQKLFIALRGDSFDAHDFLEKAEAQGAGILLVDKADTISESLCQKVTVVKVNDTLQALQDLARYWRRKHNFTVIGITGSNGKTTSKEFAATLLKQKYKVNYSKGSFNNHWGVPFTLLNSSAETEMVICEMGMNHTGELKTLCQIAEPDVVVCTTVGSSHVGELGSIEKIAEAKEEIYKYSEKAIAIFNVANEYTMDMYKHALDSKGFSQIFRFSSFSTEQVDVSLRITHMYIDQLTVTGQIAGVPGTVDVQLFGRQNINNLMVAASVALACRMKPEEIWHALPSCQTAWGRNQLYKTKSGADVIFDGYNANLESTSALMKNLYELDPKGKKYVILGEMFELGDFRESYHKQLGTLVGKCHFHHIWFLGASGEVFKKAVALESEVPVETAEQFEASWIQPLKDNLTSGDILVIKGSRGMKMERIMHTLDVAGFDKGK